jgi:hypothetical protein
MTSDDPKAETLRTYEVMASHTEFAAGYSKSLGDLVYGERPEFKVASRRRARVLSPARRPEPRVGIGRPASDRHAGHDRQ